MPSKLPYKLPYVNQPGSMSKVLQKIKDAKTPERFTQDFLRDTLSCRGGPYTQFIPLAKKLGLINSDGSPTDLYKKYRNSTTSAAALADALRIGYHEIFQRNENAGRLASQEFKGLVVEITGLEPGNRVVNLICQTFSTLGKDANFDSRPSSQKEDVVKDQVSVAEADNATDIDMNISYVFNIVLPKTDDQAVFNAIFRALRENLLRK